MTLLWLAACTGGGEAPQAAAPSAVWVDAQHVASNAHITLHAPAGATVETESTLVVVPAAEGTWDLSGEDGSYIVTVKPGGDAASVRVFLDIGVEGPTGGEMDGLSALPPPPPPVWPWVVGGAAAAAAVVAAGAWAWSRFKPVPPPPNPDPPDVIARRAWAALRARDDLGSEDVARAMSEIFRTWIDSAWGFPATRRTTREILDNLAGSLTAVELDASRRLLMATDLVKFAERSEHADLFQKLDADFEGLVRPVRRA